MWKQALRATAGVESARVDLMAHRASVVFDPALAAPQQLVEAIRGAGYDAVLPRAGDAGAAGGDRALDAAGSARKAWVTLAAGAVAMLLAMPLGTQMGAPDRLADAAAAVALCAACGFAALVPAGDDRGRVALGGARHLLERASRAAPRRHQHEHAGEPGNGVAFAYSAFATVCARAGRQVYFDAVLLILGFLLLGKSLEGRAKRRALAALDSLSRLRPVTARRVVDGVRDRGAAGRGSRRATASWFCPASAFRWTR